MKSHLLILFLVMCQASADTYDLGGAQSSYRSNPSYVSSIPQLGAVYPSLPQVLPDACLQVTLESVGSDGQYATSEKLREYRVSVKNDGPTEVEAELSVNPKNCRPGWFSWSTVTLKVPAGSSRSKSLTMYPDQDARSGEYSFEVEALAPCKQASKAHASFQIPYDQLLVTLELTGPTSESDKQYTTPNKPLEYSVSVRNDGPRDVMVELSVNPKSCRLEWFSWSTASLLVPSRVSRSEPLIVTPDKEAGSGEYPFEVEASAQFSHPGKAHASFQVQGFDYASETLVSGTGQFQISKDVRSSKAAIKSKKEISVSGNIDGLEKDEYMVEMARGRNANFEEMDKVNEYQALTSGDALMGSETFKSSAVFGGVGAKLNERYNLQSMEFKDQNFNLFQTGSLKKMADFKTADNFMGFYAIDSKQSIPGQRVLKEYDEYNGSYEVQRRILFKALQDSEIRAICQNPTGDCTGYHRPAFISPCPSGSCNDFVERLNNFAK